MSSRDAVCTSLRFAGVPHKTNCRVFSFPPRFVPLADLHNIARWKHSRWTRKLGTPNCRLASGSLMSFSSEASEMDEDVTRADTKTRLSWRLRPRSVYKRLSLRTRQTVRFIRATVKLLRLRPAAMMGCRPVISERRHGSD